MNATLFQAIVNHPVSPEQQVQMSASITRYSGYSVVTYVFHYDTGDKLHTTSYDGTRQEVQAQILNFFSAKGIVRWL